MLYEVITGPFADSVDGTFHLPRTSLYRRQRVSHRQAEVVVAVYRDNCIIDIRHILLQIADDLSELRRNCVTDGSYNFV